MHNLKRERTVVLLVVFVAALVSVAPAHADFSSTFNGGDEGWTLSTTNSTLFYRPTGGNPGGYIEASEPGGGGNWFFISPNGWNGNWTNYIGGTLRFDLLITGQTGSASVNNVRIYSGGNFVAWDVSLSPGVNVWESYSVDLTSANFDRISGTPGTTFEGVMSNVTGLYILANYGAVNTTGLDNVRVNAVPIPAAVWLLGSGLLGLVALRRRMKR